MTLARVAGIPVRLHISFVLLGGALVLFQLLSGGGGAALSGLLLALMIFGSVVLHELGHALMARVFGIRTRDITLYPFGGIAALQGEARSPTQELLIAIAGPAVNLVLALLAVPLVIAGSTLAMVFLGVNAVMAAFNLLPAYPMDGGRVLRAWLATRHGYFGGSARALRIGRGFAWAMVGAGLMWSPNLLLVGGFLLVATWQERRRLVQLAQRGTEPWARQVQERLAPRHERDLRFSHPVG